MINLRNLFMKKITAQLQLSTVMFIFLYRTLFKFAGKIDMSRDVNQMRITIKVWNQ